MAVEKVKEARSSVEKNTAISNAQKAKSELKAKRQAPKGVGDVDSSISSFGDNIQRNIAELYGACERTNLDALKIRLRQIQKNSTLMLEKEKEISNVLKNLENSKKIQPLLDSAKKIAKTLSAAASATTGFELLPAYPLLGSVFLISATLSGAELSGFFKEYKGSLEKLSFASSIAAIASANYANVFDKTSGRMMKSATFLLQSVIDSGKSFNKRKQNEHKAQYLDIQAAHQKIDFALKSFIKEIELSFEKDEQILKNIKYQILANLNLD